SHNSPYLIDFIIGTSIALPLIKVLSLIKEQKKLNKREKELDLVESKTDQELNLIIQQLTSLSETAENKAYQEIDLPYLKDRISESQNQNNEKFKAPLKHYGFANRKIDITVQATTKSTSVGSKSV
ncbi:hypothetical protein COL88_29770, partial [Bacillus thuringiensis]